MHGMPTLVLLYVPQPDLAGHLSVIEVEKEPTPGVYERNPVRGRELMYTRGSLAALLGESMLKQELAQYLGSIKYIVIELHPAYFTKSLTVVAEKGKVWAKARPLEGEEIIAELPDKKVRIRYRYAHMQTTPEVVFEDKFETVKKLLIGEKTSREILPETQKVIEKASSYVNSRLLEISRSVGLDEETTEKLRKLLLVRELLVELTSLDIIPLKLLRDFGEVKKRIRSEEAKKKLDDIVKKIKNELSVAANLAGFLLDYVEAEIEKLIEEAKNRSSRGLVDSTRH